ncbi:MAG: flavodoxin domain-containing protein [Candidatus Bathyarchaeota archaeon]|nr:MAG: flavodoxin domain-containing protein [Candidatus Bathyarchaeota archaeon]
MPRILIFYYSHTGNTEKMAEAIAEGAKAAQAVEVEVKRSESPWNLAGFDAIIIGAPTYHHGMTDGIKKFLEQIAFHEVNLKGKIGAAFGSYGWSGEAPRLVLEVMEHKLEMKVLKPPLLMKYKPDEKGLAECRRLGETVAKEVKS